nr:MAG TPA: hypothetical protein [Caudoviricetes sp.]
MPPTSESILFCFIKSLLSFFEIMWYNRLRENYHTDIIYQ